jgi:adenylosuccinate lyase
MDTLLFNLKAVCPIDGRYAKDTLELQEFFSEFTLIKLRILIELEWLQALAKIPEISQKMSLAPLSQRAIAVINNIFDKFSEEDAIHIKTIELVVNHDVKSIEYFIKEKFQNDVELQKYTQLLHFGCTSDDVNNLAHGLVLQTAIKECLEPAITSLIGIVNSFAHEYANTPMLSRTHGQPATPTTMGKEFANYAVRLQKAHDKIQEIEICGKFNGTVGNFNAHLAAFPTFNWLQICQNFVENLGLTWNLYTTQIEPHDYIAELSHAFIRLNNILLGFTQNIWAYIAVNYLKQKSKESEVGSSVMPHKINPIDFENAEGNLGLANSVLSHLANKLPISRWQRDLSDSTVMRNFGVGFAYSFIAFKSITKGLKKIAVNENILSSDLNGHWEVLGEAIQTVMRRYGMENAYETLKELTRGKIVDKELLSSFIKDLDIPPDAKNELLNLTPATYIGLAKKLAEEL